MTTGVSSRSAVSVPTGTQTIAAVFARRSVFALLVCFSTVHLAAWLAEILGAGGFDHLDMALIALFLIYIPLPLLWFWNAFLGFVFRRSRSTLLDRVMPLAAASDRRDPIISRTAIVMTIRNEDPEEAFARLDAIKCDLAAYVSGSGVEDSFDFYVLGDSNDPAIDAAVEARFAAWRGTFSGNARPPVYQRRSDGAGFEGHSVRDFAERWGRGYDFMIVLDADSLMSARRILRLVRIMQSNPRLGILQSLTVGQPAESLFARILQIGQRHTVRCAATGAMWWQADCGPYRGHNAVVRVAPYLQHCRLPQFAPGSPAGGHSHAPIEAALMCAGGYEVRELPESGGSYNGKPPALAEFIRRNNCRFLGAMQNLRLLHLPLLLPMSRYHLLAMAQRHIARSVFIPMMTLTALVAARWPSDVEFPFDSAMSLYALFFVILLGPKFLGFIDAWLRRPVGYGGRWQILRGFFVDVLFSLLLMPIMLFAATIFLLRMLLGLLPKWTAPQRTISRTEWGSAIADFWPQTVFGLGLLGWLVVNAPETVPWFAPFLAGLVVAVPFAVVTSLPWLSYWAAVTRLCATPEEIEPPREIRELRLRRNRHPAARGPLA